MKFILRPQENYKLNRNLLNIDLMTHGRRSKRKKIFRNFMKIHNSYKIFNRKYIEYESDIKIDDSGSHEIDNQLNTY